MGNELKKTFGHAGIYAIGVILNRSVSFIMLPIYTRFLTPADYGILELLEITVDVVSIITGMGIVQGLNKFYYEYSDNNERKELVSTLFILVIAAYLIACIVGALNSSVISVLLFRTPNYAYYVFISFINLLLSFLIYVPLAYLQVKQKSIFFVIISTIKLVLQLSLNILLVVFLKKGILGVLYSTLISSAILGITLTVLTFYEVGFRLSRGRAKELLKFGYPFVFSGLGAFVITFSDRYFLKYYNALSDVGVYSLGYKFGFLLMMFPVRPLFNIWMVQRFELVTRDGYEEVFNKFLSWFVILTVSVALFISLSVRDLLRIMSSPGFWAAYKIVPLILVAYLFQALTDFFNFGIHYTKNTKHIAFGTCSAAVVIILLSFALIPKYGIYGAAIATLISFAVRLSYVYLASQKIFKINYKFNNPIKTVFLATGIFATYSYCLKTVSIFNNLFLSISYVSILFILFIIFLFVLRIITPEERHVFFRLVKSPHKAFAEIKAQII